MISAGIEVLKALSQASSSSFSFNFTHFDWSSDTYLKAGRYIPEGGLDELRRFHAILFGAVGDLRVPDYISLWGLRLAICQPLQQYANVPPTRVLKGVKSPLSSCQGSIENAKKLDWVLIRENCEGEYAGHGGRSHIGHPWEVGTEVTSRNGCERLLRFAYETSQSRPRKRLTFVTKANAQRNGIVLWDEVNAVVAKDYPDVTTDKMLVDAMTCQVGLLSDKIVTVVASNLHADYSLRSRSCTGRQHWLCTKQQDKAGSQYV